jgi:hypothetical protein
VNNADMLDLMLEGAALTKPGKGYLYNNDLVGDLNFDEIHTTCAYGAMVYAQALRHGFVDTLSFERRVDNEFYDARERLGNDYVKRFGTSLVTDNDLYSRDFVVARVKELVNEQESSS